MEKIFVICSKKFYGEIPRIQESLSKKFEIILPNCYDAPEMELKMKELSKEDHIKFKGEMIRHSEDVIRDVYAVLVLNFDKGGSKNYIGGATFLEMYDAFRLHKKIFMYNDIPEGILADEIVGFNPIIINGNLEMIK